MEISKWYTSFSYKQEGVEHSVSRRINNPVSGLAYDGIVKSPNDLSRLDILDSRRMSAEAARYWSTGRPQDEDDSESRSRIKLLESAFIVAEKLGANAVVFVGLICVRGWSSAVSRCRVEFHR